MAATNRNSHLAQKWQDEIEQAIDHVKKRVKRSELDRWFKRQWYIAEKIHRMEVRRLAKEKSKPTSERPAWRC